MYEISPITSPNKPDVPVCDDDQPAVYGVSENETVSVSCSVKSYPSAVIYHVCLLLLLLLLLLLHWPVKGELHLVFQQLAHLLPPADKQLHPGGRNINHNVITMIMIIIDQNHDDWSDNDAEYFDPRYTPHSHMEFGTLLCWGTNLVAISTFHISLSITTFCKRKHLLVKLNFGHSWLCFMAKYSFSMLENRPENLVI